LRRAKYRYRIAKIQKITPQHTMRIYKRYKGVKHPKLLSRDRKTKHITQEEVEMILAVRKEHPVCAISLEKILDRKEIHIPHNRIRELPTTKVVDFLSHRCILC